MSEYSYNKYYHNGYFLTEEEIQLLNKRALEEYEAKYPMIPTEKRALRKWVALGHSVYDIPDHALYACPELIHPGISLMYTA